MIESFVSHLKVDKQIVPLLSKSTYHKSFSYAVRELVSNAYDADALTVHITISRNLKKIEVEDDGNGMSREEFDYYCTIAGQKRDIKLSRKYKRRRIGQFGIGFLSIFPFCEFLEVTTTVENSDEILTARIPAKQFFEGDGLDLEVTDIPIQGSLLKDIKLRAKHFTRISLVNPTYLVAQYFSPPKTRERKTIKNWSPLERFRWELQEDLPLPYKQDSPFNKLLKYDQPIGITVLLNGEQLYRNDPGKFTLDSGSGKFAAIDYNYLIATNYDSVDPVEARGIKIRVNNVGIGKRTDFELKRSRGFSRLHWLTGEIHISDKIKEHLNISRDSFISSNEVEGLTESFSEKLREQAYFVEDVGEAEKNLNAVVMNKKLSTVIPRGEIIQKNIDRLEKRGFKVVTRKESDQRGLEPIRIDKASKTITLSNLEKISSDETKVFGDSIKIVYKKWNYKNSEFPSCRITPDNIVEINQEYPLFQSKQYGNVFKKIHVMLLMSQKRNETSLQMFTELMKNFLREFEDLHNRIDI